MHILNQGKTDRPLFFSYGSGGVRQEYYVPLLVGAGKITPTELDYKLNKAEIHYSEGA